MDVLCLGGTGTVGRSVVSGLVARGASVRCMTRSEDNVGTADGIEFVRGDLEDPDSLAAVFEGVPRVHLLTPLHADETALGANAIRAAEVAGAERIVLHSVHRADKAPEIPHFASKMEMLDMIRETGIPWTSIEPNNYFQNDYQVKDVILGMGLYTVPMGPIGSSRVDVQDIADATVAALVEDGHEGVRYPIAGPDVLTGEAIAAIWSDALGREIHYAGDDVDAWAEASRSYMPEWMLEDLVIMFRHFVEHGLVATDEDLALQAQILDRRPNRFEDWAKDTAAAWTS